MRPISLLCLLSLLTMLGACVDGDELASAIEPSCGVAYPIVPAMDLPPMRGDAKPAPSAPVLTIAGESIKLDGIPVDGFGSLGRELQRSHDQLAEIAKHGIKVDTGSIILAAEARLPKARVAQLLTAIHESGFTNVFVLGRPVSTPRQLSLPDPKLAARLRSAGDPAMRAELTAKAITDAIWLCPDLTAIFSAIASADPNSRCELLVTGFREMGALCVGDQDAIATGFLMMSVPDAYTTFRTLHLNPDQPMNDDATWAQLLTSLGNSPTIGIQTP